MKAMWLVIGNIAVLILIFFVAILLKLLNDNFKFNRRLFFNALRILLQSMALPITIFSVVYEKASKIKVKRFRVALKLIKMTIMEYAEFLDFMSNQIKQSEIERAIAMKKQKRAYLVYGNTTSYTNKKGNSNIVKFFRKEIAMKIA